MKSVEDLTEAWLGWGFKYYPKKYEYDENGEVSKTLPFDENEPTAQEGAGLWHFSEKKGWEEIPLERGLTRNYITGLTLNEESLFAGTDQGLFELNRRSGKWKQLSQDYVLNVAASKDYVYFIETVDSIISYKLPNGPKTSIGLEGANTLDQGNIRKGIPLMLANAQGLFLGQWVYSLKDKKWLELGTNPYNLTKKIESNTFIYTDYRGSNVYEAVFDKGTVSSNPIKEVSITFVEREFERKIQKGKEGGEAYFFNMLH